MSPAGPALAHITGWDRAAIVALGAAGCALSYDALQQMAVAIHIRGVLTYLFPLVIDGFIAYGVRALVVLRAASFPARLYVWTLFGTATAASIWANALHAVRLNEQYITTGRLRLGDTTVGVLSTLAPLALAGAVHLYILIARRVTEETVAGHLGRPVGRGRTEPPHRVGQSLNTYAGQEPAALSETPRRPDTVREAASHGEPDQGLRTPTGQVTGPATPAASRVSRSPLGAGDEGGDLGARPAGNVRPHGDRPVSSTSRTAPNGHAKLPTGGDPVTLQLLPIARKAVIEAGRTTRAVVAEAIRGQGLPLSNDRLTDLMRTLRDDSGQPAKDRAA
ncbi:DUF2637 domain-containing protein [Streptomyces hygroscopicus]|uniref:DUF2637 domain-containing protein n=1 Tax=Streptomyces hygroscopicus TaxID=1912 RepID=UPI0007676432|nr:DUF2637 domain-containing protein [Streptomyces hygroscopicus]